MSKELIVMYFGTTGRPGHHITMLNGDIPIKDQCRIGGEIDADNDLYSDMKNVRVSGMSTIVESQCCVFLIAYMILVVEVSQYSSWKERSLKMK